MRLADVFAAFANPRLPDIPSAWRKGWSGMDPYQPCHSWNPAVLIHMSQNRTRLDSIKRHGGIKAHQKTVHWW